MKVQLGTGNKPLDGYVNCDVRELPGVDKVFELEKDFPYPFDNESVERVFTEETLEHLSWRLQPKIFRELARMLAPGGEVVIHVPDVGKMAEYYVRGEVCTCVPHKAPTLADFKPDPNCPNCGGTARVSTDRWLAQMCGAQKHPWDVHKTMFTSEMMTRLLEGAGFTEIAYTDHPYKLRVSARKPPA
jgi:predicted SAM-dependent methyltransferase